MALSVGARLGPYEIVSPLGAGGMGEVYRARDLRLKRDIAIKVLPETTAADPELRGRLEREAQSIAALSHPNIVTVHSVEEADGVLFLTMEYVDGKPLSDVIVKGGLPLTQILKLAIPLAEAISAAHRKGITHRDLKPANVMIGADGRVKVLDFGLAKLMEAPSAEMGATALPTATLTGEGRIVGTVAYMSPEQAEGKPLDHRSDIFSLGVMLYEMATGARPFTGDTSVSVISSIIKDTPLSVTDLKPSLPRELSRIIKRCLAKDADRRYQSAKDLGNDLEDLKQEQESGELIRGPAVGSSRRYAGPLAVAIIVAVAVTVVLASLWSRTARELASTEPPRTSHTRATQMEGVQRFPSISPDGKWVVYVSALAGNDDIYLQSVTGQTAINLTKDSPAADTMPAFSPDGEAIAFRSEREGGGIFVMGRTGESVRRLTTRGFYPAWFPDGRRIAFSTEGPPGPESRAAFSELWMVSISGGEPQRLFVGDAVQPRVSPHGKRIAFWSVPSDPSSKRLGGSSLAGLNRDVWTIDINGDHPVRVTAHEANDWNPVWSPDGRWLYFLSNRAGSMNLWRVAIDEASGIPRGEPQPVTAPSSYVAYFCLSTDGTVGAYASMLDTTNIGRVAFDARSGTTTGPVQAVTAGAHDFDTFIDVTDDGRFVVAPSSPRAQEDLYLVSTDGSTVRQLTNDVARDRVPRWSTDGHHILFQSDRSGTPNLWSIDPDGSGLRHLTSIGWRGFPLPSPDGTRLAAADLNARQIVIYDMHDFSKPLDTLPSFPDPSVLIPVPRDWSPDGRLLTITGGGGPRAYRGGVWVYSFETRTYRRITAEGAYSRWLHDGRRLIYANLGRLFVAEVSSGMTREVLAISGESLASPCLTADNSQLFFTRATSAGDIWIVRFGERTASLKGTTP
jgi:serine/threonine protein kinase/Tol biopolymer transport system component